MKKMIILLLLLAATSARAQRFAEWFRQNKTQEAYLLEQIAALQLYQGYATDGYALAQEGLEAIGQSSGEEYGLHESFFRSLGRVNPAVRRYGKVAAIIALQDRVREVSETTSRQLLAGNALEAAEEAYIYRVFDRLLRDCTATMAELVAVTTDGTLAMNDAQRLTRIDFLFRAMQEKYLFAKRFAAEARLLAAARLQAKTDLQTSRLLHGITREEP